LTLGEVAGAVRDAEQSLAYADRSGDADWQNYIRTRTTHADALHQAGHRAEAEARFREAEKMQAKGQPDYPLMYSMAGFRYCELLLTDAERAAWQQRRSASLSPVPIPSGGVSPGCPNRGTPPEPAAKTTALLEFCRTVEQRTAQTLKWAEDNNLGLLTTALDHLTLGRATLYRAILENSDFRLLASDFSHIDTAVTSLRSTGQLDHLPRGLLTRAWLRSLTGARTGSESAQGDLDEAWEIAERGPMPLFLADIHLHRARLFGRQKEEGRMQNGGTAYPWESPQADLAEARRLIYKHGYLRRKEELEDAEKALLG